MVELKYSIDCSYTCSFQILGECNPFIKDHSKALYLAAPFDLRSGDGDRLLQFLMCPSDRNRSRLSRIDLVTAGAEKLFDFQSESRSRSSPTAILECLEIATCKHSNAL
ncbi:hypothetical protein Trydic_g13960 [Trypoxylus dichotomus]